MRWCKGCKSAGECEVCYFETPVGHITGLKIVELFLKWAADRNVQEELLKKIVEELVKLEIKAVGQEALTQLLLALEAVTSPWMLSPIVTEFIAYYAFKSAGSSEEDARYYSSAIGLGTSMVAGGCVAGPVGIAVGGAAWIIGHTIPDPVVPIMKKLMKVMKMD